MSAKHVSTPHRIVPLLLSVAVLSILLSACLKPLNLQCSPCESDGQCSAPLVCDPASKRCINPQANANQCAGVLEGVGGGEHSREAAGHEVLEPASSGEEPSGRDASGESIPVKDASPEEEGSSQEPASDVPGEATSSELSPEGGASEYPVERPVERGEDTGALEQRPELVAERRAEPSREQRPEPVVEKVPEPSACEKDARFGAACTAGLGSCKQTGKWVCSGDKQRVVCNAQADDSKKKAEECNGVDDDCDGKVDESIAAQNCYTGAAGTRGVGPCKAGTRSCRNGAWSVCNGQVIPLPSENCKNCVDDDCNGKVNDTCSWALSFSGNRNVGGVDVRSDNQCNTYVVGDYTGALTVGQNQLPGVGSRNGLFVARVGANQAVSWANAPTGGGYAWSASVGVDNSSNVYAGGMAEGTMTWGTLPSLSTPYTNRYVFVAKMDPSGKPLWAKSILSDIRLGVSKMRHGLHGFTYVFGTYYGELECGTLPKKKSLTTFYPDLFVAKLNNAGTCLWASRFGGTQIEGATDLAIDPRSNVYLVGQYTKETILGSTKLTHNDSSNHMFVAKLDSGGSKITWTYQPISATEDAARGVAVDANQNVYVLGIYRGSVMFTPTLSLSSTTYAMFVLKLNFAGTPLSAIQVKTSSGVINPRGIVVDKQTGVVSVVGSFRGTFAFGPNMTISTTSSSHAFIARLAADARSFVSVHQTKASGTANPKGLDLAPSHHLVTGHLIGNVTFDSTTLNKATNSFFLWQTPLR